MNTHLQPPPTSRSKEGGHVRMTSEDRRRMVSVRRPSKGPLEPSGDPLASPTSPASSTPLSPPARSGSKSPSRKSFMEQESRDLTFLLQPNNFTPIPPPINPPTSVPERTHAALLTLVQKGQFNSAANLSAQLITNLPDASDTSLLFGLWYIRLASLTLIHQTRVAGAESKVLGDLTSSFYRDQNTGTHIVPWHLRVLAVRLQALGFGEWRRALMVYYILAEEARTEGTAAQKVDDRAALRLWKTRLQDLGVLVASALVEMGDMSGAARHMRSLQKDKDLRGHASLNYIMMECLIWLKVGDIKRAAEAVSQLKATEEAPLDEDETYVKSILDALVITCQGETKAAHQEWSDLNEKYPGDPLIQHNLATSALYICNMITSKDSFDALVSNPDIPTFYSLLFNTATLYELNSENATSLKRALAEEVAHDDKQKGLIQERSPQDFKISVS